MTGNDCKSAENLHDLQTRQFVETAFLEMLSDLRAFLRGILRNDAVVDDALQRTFISSVNACHHARTQTIRGWLFRIALNEARQLIRGERRSTKIYAEQLPSHQQVCEAPIDQDLIHLELEQAIRKSLQSLPAEYQEVINRRIFLEMPFARIADEMNLPIGTVLTWMRRGLNKLRENAILRNYLEERSS